MDNLAIRDLQRLVADWIQTVGVRYFSELTNLAQLMEEVGEVARIISRVYGEQSFKDEELKANLADELADVLFVLVCLANQTGVDLETAIRHNLDKKTVRDSRRHILNPKLNAWREPLTGMEFINIPAGRFLMGDTLGQGTANELPTHEVQLSGFFLGKYPVTQGQWKIVTGSNPARFAISDDHPVEQVSWHEVQAFIQQLQERTASSFRFRLPTEAEWEYAARSGGRDELYAGGDVAVKVAWFNENSSSSTQPVGRKAPNGLGLFDMSGNVWEWCQDCFVERAYDLHQTAHPIILDGGRDRVIRGGSWHLDAWSLRCARRFGFSTEFLGPGVGFRLALSAA